MAAPGGGGPDPLLPKKTISLRPAQTEPFSGPSRNHYEARTTKSGKMPEYPGGDEDAETPFGECVDRISLHQIW